MYPALAIVQALGEQREAVLWVGGEGGMEGELIGRTGLPFAAVPAAGLHGVDLRRLPGNLWQLLRGVWAARKLVREYRPDAMLFTGGFVAVPVALAGWRVPSLAYVPDIEPALAMGLVSRLADKIAVTTEMSRGYYPKADRVMVTGYPTRAELQEVDKEDAYRTFGLSPVLPTLLVMGGSKGAQSINRALVAILPELLKEMQVVHISGTLTWPEVEAAQAKLPDEQKARYRPYDYLHERMGAALAVADLVVARAGAATLGEFPLFGLPAILVPLTVAWGSWRYQQVNANYLAEQGAAVVLPNEALVDELFDTVRELMDDEGKRARMSEAMRALAKPEAAEKIAKLLLDMARETVGRD